MPKESAFLRLESSGEARAASSLLLAAILLVSPGRSAVAEDSLGLYVGGTIGQSRVAAEGTVFQGDLHLYDKYASVRSESFGVSGNFEHSAEALFMPDHPPVVRPGN